MCGDDAMTSSFFCMLGCGKRGASPFNDAGYKMMKGNIGVVDDVVVPFSLGSNGGKRNSHLSQLQRINEW